MIMARMTSKTDKWDVLHFNCGTFETFNSTLPPAINKI